MTIDSILDKVDNTTGGYDTTNSKSNKKEQNSLGVPIANECAATGCLVVPLARSHNAFHIIGDAGAAQHCRGLDDIPFSERCHIRKVDRPLVFATANGEVPCDEAISTEIVKLGITRDMHVMKDSRSVIAMWRLVVDNGYDSIWRHKNRKAMFFSRKELDISGGATTLR